MVYHGVVYHSPLESRTVGGPLLVEGFVGISCPCPTCLSKKVSESRTGLHLLEQPLVVSIDQL